ncbi:MAG: hypothetical protein ACP5EP_12380 [Acidobacteriaceae bacterium]
MDNLISTSEQSVPKPQPIHRRKRRTKEEMLAAKQAPDIPYHPPAEEPVTAVAAPLAAPSAAIIQLQSQVVELVNERTNCRQRLTQTHLNYLRAQGEFQAVQSELQGIEQEVQYRIGLIAQLENRVAPAPAPTMPMTFENPMTGISSVPTQTSRPYQSRNEKISEVTVFRDQNLQVGPSMI